MNNKIAEFIQDSKRLKSEIQEDRANAPVSIKNFLFDQRWKFITLSLAIIVLVNQEWYQIEITESQKAFAISAIVGVIVAYPYVRWLADYFIEDNRIPILENDPEDSMNDIAIHKLPRDRITDIEMIEDTELHEIRTKMGMGYEVRNLQIWYDDNGRQNLTALGTWLGELNGLELRRERENINEMYNMLIPMAQDGIELQMKLPSIVHQLEKSIANQFTYQFQENINFKGKEIQTEIENIIDENQTDNSEEKESKTVEDIEELVEMLNENGEQSIQEKGETKQ